MKEPKRTKSTQTQSLAAKGFRRENRKRPTKSEELLWSILRGKQVCGLKFRRQHSIDRWIVDFACVSKKLVIEIDGGYHDYVAAEDLNRELNIRALGWSFFRVSDKDVEDDPEAVSVGIAKHLGLKFEFKERRKTGSGRNASRRIVAKEALPARSSRPSQREGE